MEVLKMTARSTMVSNEAVRLVEIEEQCRAFQSEFHGSRKDVEALKSDVKNLQLGVKQNMDRMTRELQETKYSVKSVENSMEEMKIAFNWKR